MSATFDYPKFAEPLRDRIRECAQEVCAANGVSIEHVNKSHIRKEDLVARVLAERGNAPGLVHVISAMESCPSYKPWLDKSNGRIFLRGDTGKCLHDYFYFIDEEFGLCYLRVPTWAPFGLQFYCNGVSVWPRHLEPLLTAVHHGVHDERGEADLRGGAGLCSALASRHGPGLRSASKRLSSLQAA